MRPVACLLSSYMYASASPVVVRAHRRRSPVEIHGRRTGLPFLVLLCWTGCMPSVVIHVRLQRLLALTLPFPPHVNREKKMVLLTWCNPGVCPLGVHHVYPF